VYTQDAQDAKSQLDEFLRVICEQLQLPPYRYQLADQRYGTNRFLEALGSPFAAHMPRTYPQGSMALGATVKHDGDPMASISSWNFTRGISRFNPCQ
jgi:hypothetical protein